VKTDKKTVTNTQIREAIKRKSIQMTEANMCSHCGQVFTLLGKHTNGCLMNPERKMDRGFVTCDKCHIDLPGKNHKRHYDACSGDATYTIDRILQSFRSDYLNIVRGGQKVTKIDRSLGFGNRAVPSVVRNNVEMDLRARGMDDTWSISPTLRVIKPETDIITDIELAGLVDTDSESSPDVIGAVVDLIVDERTMAEVLNQIINLATYKLATR
jgi:hypothetical protein